MSGALSSEPTRSLTVEFTDPLKGLSHDRHNDHPDVTLGRTRFLFPEHVMSVARLMMVVMVNIALVELVVVVIVDGDEQEIILGGWVQQHELPREVPQARLDIWRHDNQRTQAASCPLSALSLSVEGLGFRCSRIGSETVLVW
jgi:hypothetical protein